MPITQDRMLRLIACAEHYAQLYLDLRESVMQNYQTAKQSGQWERGCDDTFSTAFKLKPSDSHATVLATEREHFRHCAARNIKRAAKLEHHRRALGLPTRQKRAVQPDEASIDSALRLFVKPPEEIQPDDDLTLSVQSTDPLEL